MTVALGLALAVAAALSINAAYLVQHAGLARLPAMGPRGSVESLRLLLGSARWRRGAALGYAGLGLYIAALALAPLALVQSVVAAGLVVVLTGSRRFTGERALPHERAAVALTVGALSLLAVGAGRRCDAISPRR